MRLFIIFMTALIFLFFRGNAQSQCDSLKSVIKDFAKRHVENNAPMQTGVIVNIIESQGCFTKAEVATIYESEYSILKKKQQNIFYQPFAATGWVIGLVSIIILAFQEFFKKKLAIFGDRVDLFFATYFSGAKSVHRARIKKYKESLVRKYREIKMPFRQNKPFMMQDVYIPLKINDQLSSEACDAVKSLERYNRLMIIGPPGSGKSMLCKHVLFSFGLNKLESNQIPVYIELYRLNNVDVSITKLIIDELGRNSFYKPERNIEYLLKNNKFFLLFDGYDEVSSSERKRVAISMSDFLEQNKCSNYIITCRNAVYQNEFANIVEQTMSIVEFTSYQIRKFLESWEPSVPANKSIDQLMIILNDNPKIMTLATNPLMLTIIAYLYADTSHTLPHSRAEFYQIATDVLLNQWHNERNSFDAIQKALILQKIALSNQERNIGDKKLIRNTTLIFEIAEICPMLGLNSEDATKILKEIVERSGLLLVVDGGEFYQFAHLTMQEFLAAKQLRDDSQAILERFAEDPDNWREPIKLWCGLANDATFLITELFKKDKLAAFECMAEAKSINPEIAEKVLAYFTDNIESSELQSERICKAFGLVASSKNNWGISLFKFIQEEFLATTSVERLTYILKCIEYTFLPKAAELLVKNLTRRESYVFRSLVNMGDIAVPAIKREIEVSNNNKLLSCLFDIKTPDAATSLVSVLWNDSDSKYFSALYLSELITEVTIQNALKDAKNNQFKTDAGYAWVGHPFSENLNSAIGITINRIVFVIFEFLKVSDRPQVRDVKCDLRIIVPLVILGQPIKTKRFFANFTDEKKTWYNWDRQYVFTVDSIDKALKDLINENSENKVLSFCLAQLPNDLCFKFAIGSFQSSLANSDWADLYKPVPKNYLDKRTEVIISLLYVGLLIPCIYYVIKIFNDKIIVGGSYICLCLILVFFTSSIRSGLNEITYNIGSYNNYDIYEKIFVEKREPIILSESNLAKIVYGSQTENRSIIMAVVFLVLFICFNEIVLWNLGIQVYLQIWLLSVTYFFIFLLKKAKELQRFGANPLNFIKSYLPPFDK